MRWSGIVYEEVLATIPVTTTVMPIEEAKKSGARAFDEKYGDEVRVLDIKGFSTGALVRTHVVKIQAKSALLR